MANEITTTVNANVINSEVLGIEIQESIKAAEIMWPLMTTRDISGEHTMVASFPRFEGTSGSGFIAASVAEDAAGTNQDSTLGEATVTCTESQVTVYISKPASRTSMPYYKAALASEIGRALAEYRDAAACALLGGFTNVVGTPTVDITFPQMVSAITTLNLTAKGASHDAVFVLYPQQIGDLRALAFDATQGLSTAMSRTDLINFLGGPNTVAPNAGVLNAYQGDFLGIPIFSSTHVTTANVGADSAGGLIKISGALCGASVWTNELDIASCVSAGKSGEQWLGNQCVGVAEYNDNYGVSIITDR